VDGQAGICLTRVDQDGVLYSTNYFRPVSTAVDPIEKKPLYHFHPGTEIFSTGPNGCTFKCSFCQNSDISQTILPTHQVRPQDLLKTIVDSGTIGIAYTYSEPYIWFETIMELGVMVREAGLVNVMVTNGYMEPAPLADLLTVVDAMNIDIKSMNPTFYKVLCKGDLAPVLRSCEQVKKAGCHLEITNLIITGENDSDDEIDALISFIAGHLGADTPLHFSRYFPRHQMDHPATPPDTLTRAWERARERLEYVYLGNIESGKHSDTSCPKCGTVLISRAGYSINLSPKLKKAGDKHSVCGSCGATIPVI